MNASLTELESQFHEVTRQHTALLASVEAGRMAPDAKRYGDLLAKADDLRRQIASRGSVRLGSYVKALIQAKGDRHAAALVAESEGQFAIARALKEAIPPASTTNPAFAGALVDTGADLRPVLTTLRQGSLLGIAGMHEAPFNTPMPHTTQGAGTTWMIEGKPKPITKLGFETIPGITPAKISSIIVVSKELMRQPKAEATLETELMNAVRAGINSTFLGTGAGDEAMPKGLLNGVTPIDGSSDLSGAINQAIAALPKGYGPAVWIADQVARATISPLLETSGLLAGLSVVTEPDLPAGTLVLLLPGAVWYYLDDLSVDVAEQASVQMLDNPTEAPTQLISLYPRNWVALRCEAFCNWQAPIANSVQSITLS